MVWESFEEVMGLVEIVLGEFEGDEEWEEFGEVWGLGFG